MHLQIFPLPEDLKREIEEAAKQLHDRLKAEQEEIWRDLTLIQSGPPLTTINGMGCTIYGRTPFAGDPAWYMTTYYFVFLFIPIFPIRRYLVADAPGGGWYFRASAPLTTGNKGHLAVALVLATVFLGFCVITAGMSANTPYGSRYSGYSSRDTTSASGYPSPDRVDNVVASPEQVKLEGELAPLNTEIYHLQQSLDERKAALESTGKHLDTDKKKVNRRSRAAVKAYNARVYAFNKASRKYDADVKVYNAKLKRAEAMEARIRELKK
jgi:hypothetical protein